MKTETRNGYTIETWYDPHTRLWVTEIKDAHGTQAAPAEHTSCDGIPGALAICRHRIDNGALPYLY